MRKYGGLGEKVTLHFCGAGPEYDKLAQHCATRNETHVQYLPRLSELELIERERRMIERRIKAAKFPAFKSLDRFDVTVMPSLNKPLVMELARSEYIDRRENIIALGPSGTGTTHVALGLGRAACRQGLKVRFITAASLVHELIEARDDQRLLRLQKQLTGQNLLIIDELGFVPLSKTGAELLFELISQCYECGSIIMTSNLPFDEWTDTFGSERLTGALLDRLTHHVHSLEMNGGSFRLKHSKKRKIPKNENSQPTGLTPWTHRSLPRALLRLRSRRAPQCARAPPMDYRDKPTRHRSGVLLRRRVVDIYSGVDKLWGITTNGLSSISIGVDFRPTLPLK